MKWLFIIIVLINISFFIYNAFYLEAPHKKNSQFKKNDNTQIILLSELDASELQTLQDNKIVIDKPIETKNNVTAPEIMSVKTDEAASHDAAVSGSTKITENSEDAVTQESVMNKSLCYSLGPFTKKVLDDIRFILEKEYQNQLSFKIETTSASTYYRIYIPPLENKEKINETIQLLDRNRLKDHYVMSINGRKNAIALGVFKQRNAAEKVAIQANKIGLSTTIEAISNDKNSLYKLQVLFQQHHKIKPYQEIIIEKKLKSTECINKG